jgi:hypothetical protein
MEAIMIHLSAIEHEELSLLELDRVAGGVVGVGWVQHHFQLAHSSSVLDRVALNPQPLPPKVFSFGHLRG